MFQNGIQDAKSQDTPLGTAPPSRNTFVLRNVKHFTELSQIYPSSSDTIQNIQFTAGNLSSL